MQQNLAAGTPSDLIFTEGNACFPSYVTKNYFQPITDLIQQDLGSSFMDEASMKNFQYTTFGLSSLSISKRLLYAGSSPSG